MPASNIDRLRETLDELFMLDRADLDFGLYRIMNVRRDEVRRFLDEDLLPKVRAALGQMQAGEHAATEAEMRALEKTLRDADVDPATSPKFRELEAKYHAGGNTEADEAEVYGHLVSFFRRYYKEGDFISLRRYKEGVYAIPYEGEEVKLHWANADQYYIKSTEQFRDYTFLPWPEDHPDRRVHFKLVEADTERNNNRAQAGQDRRFVLVEADPVVEVDGDLVVRFEYRPANGAKQDALNTEAEATVLDHPAAKAWRSVLARDARRDGAKEALSLLRKHLNTYTAKNTFDYFIHKDLGGFLRRELDFYLKNEVLHLDDIDTDGATSATLEAALRKVRAIRAVGLPIIEFLASLEEFQKRLWLKKKFVVETHWCVTLDRVPRDLYSEVAANDRQREEWVHLFAIDEIAGNMMSAAYSVPLSEAFLEANQHLVLDTSLFDRAFTERLLASINDLDETADGLLVHGDNYQALNLLLGRYRRQIGCTFIDPPYNTGVGDFAYKDTFQHSSWLSMIEDRALVADPLLSDGAATFITIDDIEAHYLKVLLDQTFLRDDFVANVVWQKKSSPQSNATWISDSHDHVMVYAKGKEHWTPTRLARTEEQNAIYRHSDEFDGVDDSGKWYGRGPWFPGDFTIGLGSGQRGRQYARTGQSDNIYPIVTPSGREVLPAEGRAWAYVMESYERLRADNRVHFGRDGSSKPTIKRFLGEIAEAGIVPMTVWHYKDVGENRSAIQQIKDIVPTSGFTTPKPLGLVERAIGVSGVTSAFILDYFAGSGTTGHAVINLNREDDGQRKYILVEMGEYFDTVLKPRVLKAVYSKDWKDGKPIGREGVSQLIKVIRLESYEDTLTNLRNPRPSDQQASMLNKAGDDLRQQYALRYWLTEETRGSASLLDLERFEDPWSYTLEIGQGSAAETKPVTVDLVETFNYLLGLRVQHVDHIRGVTLVQGTLPPAPGKATSEKALVIWRNTREMDAEALDKFLWGQHINPRDLEFDVIYVNGDNHLENSRRTDETWKVRLIEDEFHRLMFETAEQERKQ